MARLKQQPLYRHQTNLLSILAAGLVLGWSAAGAGAQKVLTGKSDVEVLRVLSGKTNLVLPVSSGIGTAKTDRSFQVPELTEEPDATGDVQREAVGESKQAESPILEDKEPALPNASSDTLKRPADESAAWASGDPRAAEGEEALSSDAELQLEVTINNVPIDTVAAFTQRADGKMTSPRSELKELGIAAPGDGDPDELIELDSIGGLSYAYDEDNQTIAIEVGDTARLAKLLNTKDDQDIAEAISSSGAVLNYTAYGSASYKTAAETAGMDAGSLTFDARAFSRFGAIQQTGVAGTTTFDDLTAVRYDSVWSYSDQKRAMSYRLGDIISGGLGWTRPIRLGGGQVHRNFDLRPDLITMPLPDVEGSAKVPSTVDVYIDGFKAYSGSVKEGPFKLDSLPVYTTSGTVKMVLTDSSGREISSESEFVTSPDLLKTDLYDFSIDSGVFRRDFGVDNFGYSDEPVLLGSLRYGVTDWLTGEAHAEAGLGLISGGAGLLISGGKLGMFNAAVAASSQDGKSGAFIQAGWDGRIGGFALSASMSRSFDEYRDLAAISSVDAFGRINPASGVPKALDRISINYSLRELKAGIGASFIHQESGDGKQTLLLSGSYTQTIGDNITVLGTAFADFGDERQLGGYVSVSIPLGETITSSATMSVNHSAFDALAEVSKPFDDEAIPVAWRVAHSEGSDRVTSANGAVRTNYATLQGELIKQRDALRATATAEGSLVIADGSVMAGRKIGDSFAIVNVGAKDVPVLYQNRLVGKTGSNGKILLPQLNSFQKNKIAIDVADLPINADVAENEMIVVPRDKSGVVVSFGVKADEAVAIIVLRDSAGALLPEGSEVFLEDEAEPFVVGYDGQVYLTGLKPRNSIVVKHPKGDCNTSFDFTPQSEAQPMIGPITCN